jgi:hypothetical protein
VPRAIRVPCARVSLSSAAGWAVGALFLSVVPSYAASLLDTEDLALAGAGLGLAYFGAQAEVNRIAPPERSGEVTAAFITCQYAFVSVTAISVGLISDADSLAAAVRAAGAAIALVAAGGAAWHMASRPRGSS